MFKYLTMLTLASLLGACATEPLTLSESAEQDYHKAERLIAENFNGRAALYLGKFAAKYPYSKYATPAELLRIKAAYNNEEFILSETLSKRFIEAHPNHPELDYVQYTLAMSYFHQSEDASHEQVFSQKARDAFIALNQQNPNHKYKAEVDKYLNIVVHRMAKHEMLIGKFYYERNFFVAATNRFIVVKNKFMNTDIAAESLYWLASSYLALQQDAHAKEVIQTLSQQFPGNAWQKKAENLL